LFLKKRSILIAKLRPRNRQPKAAPKVAAESATTAQFEARVPDTMRALAEKNVAQTRELYDRSKNAFQAVLESWEKSLGGALALNRMIIDIAERNVASSFDLVTCLAGTRNLTEAMASQTAYWRKQVGDLSAQAEEVRALATKVSANVAEPIKAQLTRVNGLKTK
jgi:hypothetical protein